MKKPKTIRTPFGDITLLPISTQEMEQIKQSLLTNPELELELEEDENR
ncbi:MAG: hypothetical protein KAJ55_11995 [Anaerolineales bacterium]|nr:hypothetical protein [Anaerolineales bacterium]